MAWSIGNLFGGGSGGIQHGGGAQPMQLPTANPQQQISGGDGQGGTGGNPVSGAPAAPAPAPAPSPQDSLLESMAKLWQTPTTADGKPVAPAADPLTQQIHSFDPKKLGEQVKTLDFTKTIPDEVIAKALTGDTGAFRSMLNESLQGLFAGSTMNAATLINQGFGKYSQLVDQALPDRLKQFQIQSTQSEDPILSHPAVLPLMNALKGVAATTKPGASAAEIQTTAEEFLKGFATLMATNQQTSVSNQQAEKEPDWLSFAGLAPKK